MRGSERIADSAWYVAWLGTRNTRGAESGRFCVSRSMTALTQKVVFPVPLLPRINLTAMLKGP